MMTDSIHKYSYLLTISCQQKKEYVSREDLDRIINWLQQCGVIFQEYCYENHGLYGQLHVHAIVIYKGKYSKLTKWGDTDYLDTTFRIHWKKINSRLTKIREYMHK